MIKIGGQISSIVCNNSKTPNPGTNDTTKRRRRRSAPVPCFLKSRKDIRDPIMDVVMIPLTLISMLGGSVTLFLGVDRE